MTLIVDFCAKVPIKNIHVLMDRNKFTVIARKPVIMACILIV